MRSSPLGTAPLEVGPEQSLTLPAGLLRELCAALQAIRYGTIELVIHDGRVVQLERREKVRFDTDAGHHRR